jgi:cell division protein FtsW
MATVVGLVPITGIPLPLISFGGSALILTLFGLGMLLSFARTEPGAQKALAARRGIVRSRVLRRSAAVPRQRRPAPAARRPATRTR